MMKKLTKANHPSAESLTEANLLVQEILQMKCWSEMTWAHLEAIKISNKVSWRQIAEIEGVSLRGLHIRRLEAQKVEGHPLSRGSAALWFVAVKSGWVSYLLGATHAE